MSAIHVIQYLLWDKYLELSNRKKQKQDIQRYIVKKEIFVFIVLMTKITQCKPDSLELIPESKVERKTTL